MKPSGSQSISVMMRARAVLYCSPSRWRFSVSSWPAKSFSASLITPPVRLTSRVCARRETATPPGANHVASTGIRKLTRSLWRRPSERRTSVMFRTQEQASMRPSLRRRRRTARLSFPIITADRKAGGAAGPVGGPHGGKGIVVLALTAEQSDWRREEFGHTESTGALHGAAPAELQLRLGLKFGAESRLNCVPKTCEQRNLDGRAH